MSVLLPSLHNLMLALIPIVAAGLSSVAIKRAVPALFLALLPLAYVVIRAHPENGFLLEAILTNYRQQIGHSIFTVLLLSAGVALIHNGPAHGFARRLIGRIRHPVLRRRRGDTTVYRRQYPQEGRTGKREVAMEIWRSRRETGNYVPK